MEKLIFALTKLMLVLAILLSYMPYSTKVLAQNQAPNTSKKPEKKPDSPQTKKPPPLVFVWPPTPRSLTNITGRARGTGSRGCSSNIDAKSPVQPPLLTALVPFPEQDLTTKQQDKSNNILWGLTTLERPTFWFYVAYTKDVANLNPEFVLLDDKEKKVYKKAIALPAKPGIIGVSLPSTVAPLEVGKLYQWNFNIYCPKTEAGNSVVKSEEREIVNLNGYIQRVNPSLEVAEQLAITSDPRVKIAIYAAAGIWYDSLTLLAQLRLANPNDVDLATDWQNLLESVKLSQISTAPLVN